MSEEILAFDTEDNTQSLIKRGKSLFDKKMTIAATCDCHETRTFKDVEKLKEFIKTHPAEKIYSHNLQYDIGNLFRDEIDELDFTMIGGRIIKLHWGGKTFLDSFNLFPMALKKVGKIIGLEKIDFDETGNDYVTRDAEIVYHAVKMFQTFLLDKKIDKISPTLGGNAIKIWQSLGGKNESETSIKHRLAYKGGWVELYNKKGDDCSMIDINSLYPWTMTQSFPIGCSYSKDIKKHGILRAEIEMPEDYPYPFIPIKDEEGCSYRPIGSFETCLTMPELRKLEAIGGRLLKLKWFYGSDKESKPYSRYVTQLYNDRLKYQNEKSPFEHVCKLLLNNLYGQLGMTGIYNESELIDEENYEKYLSDKIEAHRFGKRLFIEKQGELREHVNYVHASYVTAMARLRLLHFLEKFDPSQIFYCDTDSIVFSGKNKIQCSDKLGEMKLCAENFSFEVVAPKMYRMGDEYKIKGVKKDNMKEFWKTGKTKFHIPFKMRQAVKFFTHDQNNNERESKNLKPLSVWHEIEKEFRTIYNKKSLINNKFYPIKVSRAKCCSLNN